MKLTIEINSRIVTVEEDSESIDTLIEMFAGACKAQGFHPETIKKYLDEDE